MFIEYEGNRHLWGLIGSCWLYMERGRVIDVCRSGHPSYGGDPDLRVNLGDDVSLVVLNLPADQDGVRAWAHPVLGTESDLESGPGFDLTKAGEGVLRSLPPGLYYLTWSYSGRLGVVKRDFKLEIVEWPFPGSSGLSAVLELQPIRSVVGIGRI